MCPRVRTIAFHEGGEVSAVEFFEPDDASVQEFVLSLDGDALDQAVSAELQLEPGTYGEITVRILRRLAGVPD